MNENTSELKKNEYEPLPPDEKEIDRLLAEMAKTAPEAPADFHDRWMNAVRGEAGKQKGPVSQWTKILSVAAAFVLLIGGVILVRSNGQKQQTQNLAALPASGKTALLPMNTNAPAEEKAAPLMASGAAYEVEPAMYEASEAEEAYDAGAASEEAAYAGLAVHAAYEADRAYEEPMEEAGWPDELGNRIGIGISSFLMAVASHMSP